jgi:hypothetical protein
MKILKQIVGFLLMLLSPLTWVVLLMAAVHNIRPDAVEDIQKPVPWIIILIIWLPISVGLCLFGYYAFRKEYEEL